MGGWIPFVALWAILAGIASSTMVDNVHCIPGCKCKSTPLVLQISDCKGRIDLNQTTLKNLPAKINFIYFTHVNIVNIEVDAFKNFLNLHRVEFLDSTIELIHTEAFSKIKILRFFNTPITNSPDLESETLEELNIIGCNLYLLPLFNKLPNLRILNLSNNQLSILDLSSFLSLYNLEQLYLSNNSISKFPPNLFTNNKELSILHLDRNPLKRFYYNVTTNQLENLNLQGCKLSHFDLSSTTYLRSLSELNLSNNMLYNISADAFSHMTELNYIDLSNNRLTKLDENIFSNNSYLEKVVLDGNRFDSLPVFKMDGKFEIASFSCKHCGLRSIPPNAFKNMPALTTIELSYNEIENIDYLCRDLFSLNLLDVSYNRITKLDKNTFISTPNLSFLKMDNNPIREISGDVFKYTTNLKKLYLRQCKLNKLWTNKYVIFPNLNTLLVSDNNIQSLSKDNFKIMPRLQSIALKNNPLKVDENTCDLYNWLTFESSIFLIELKKEVSSFDGEQTEIREWNTIFTVNCPLPTTAAPAFDEIYGDDDDDDDDDDDEDNDDNYDDNYSDFEQLEFLQGKHHELDDKDDDIVIGSDEIKYLKSANILSVTFVFIITALVVLAVALTIILCILKKNSTIPHDNLPRFKILPTWPIQNSFKKHSDITSVYRPLSEDISDITDTPKFSRYEFKIRPDVHNI